MMQKRREREEKELVSAFLPPPYTYYTGRLEFALADFQLLSPPPPPLLLLHRMLFCGRFEVDPRTKEGGEIICGMRANFRMRLRPF